MSFQNNKVITHHTILYWRQYINNRYHGTQNKYRAQEEYIQTISTRLEMKYKYVMSNIYIMEI